MMSSTLEDNDNVSSEVAGEVGNLGEVTQMGLMKERALAGSESLGTSGYCWG